MRRASPSISERVANEDGIVALGRGRQQGDRALDQLFNMTNVFDCLSRQVSPFSCPARRLRPAIERLVDRLGAGLAALAGGQAVRPLASGHIADAKLDLLEAVEDIELSQGDAVDAGDLGDLADQNGIEPAAAAL